MTPESADEGRKRGEALASELRHIAKEIRPLSDAVDSLYLLLQHVWQNRDELFELLHGVAEEERDTIRCERCPQSTSLLEAVRDGWKELRDEDGTLWGRCELCHAAVPMELDKPPNETVSCKTCDARFPDSLAHAVRAGWTCIIDDEGNERGNFAGQCPKCSDDKHRLPAQVREHVEYCCDSPKLEWDGDPDAPSVICASCGFVVAEAGQVIGYGEQPDEQIRDPDKKEDQRSLF